MDGEGEESENDFPSLQMIEDFARSGKCTSISAAEKV